MRTLAVLVVSGVVLLGRACPAHAQAGDAERAAARELFKEGDELQRAGKFADALDKFQRAQFAYRAPTNQLRVAQCEAALGRLVEAADSYRAVAHTPLAPGSPPPFQAAVDQAGTELAQLEPRVPRLVLQLQPAQVPGARLQIDGQDASAALLGQPIPLDAGTHRVSVLAPGFAGVEQRVSLAERDVRTLTVALRPIAAIAGPLPTETRALPPPPPPLEGTATPSALPPPPPVVDTDADAARSQSRRAILLGAHLGWELAGGSVPADTQSVDASAVSSGGVAYALEGGLRFARHWYVGLVLQHATLGDGADASRLNTPTQTISRVSSDSSVAGVVVGFVVNPERVSFYGEAGLANRWYSYTAYASDGQSKSSSFSSGELLLGGGLWIPLGSAVCLVPKASLALGSFTAPDSSRPAGVYGASAAHAFFLIGLAGFYSIRL
ncbi:MAG: hypothetical protein M3O50_20660 [Myxococcota bacterium]|nr:hypothetical protein [Myxococcota bacterium]